jgi:hypothetical protein
MPAVSQGRDGEAGNVPDGRQLAAGAGPEAAEARGFMTLPRRAALGANPCDNMNHRRRDAPVSHCPQCGGSVNDQVRSAPCSETKHAAARRRQSAYCVDCGTALIIGR